MFNRQGGSNLDRRQHPTHPTVAPLISADLHRDPPYPLYTPWCNQLGLPAAAVHAGTGSDGLPIGLQLIGRQYDDLTVLRASHAFQQAFGTSPAIDTPASGIASAAGRHPSELHPA